MKITEFRTEHDKTFLLLPGTSCTWECNFDLLLKSLAEEYHVLCVNYTGFDGEPAIFDTQTADTARIEQYVQQRFGGHLDAVYGSSMGGSFASLLVQRKKIHIDHVFIGSSDLDQASPFVAKIETAIISIFLKRLAKNPEKALQKFSKVGEAKGMGMSEDDFKKDGVSEDYMQHMLKGFCDTLQKVDMQSVKNQFYSDLVTKLDDNISAPETVIHVFHSKKMGEKYLQRYPLMFLYMAYSAHAAGVTGFWHFFWTGYIEMMFVNAGDFFLLDVLGRLYVMDKGLIKGAEQHPDWNWSGWKKLAVPEHGLIWTFLFCPMTGLIVAGIAALFK